MRNFFYISNNIIETAAGYAIFKAKDKLLKKRDALIEDLKSPEGASNLYVCCMQQLIKCMMRINLLTLNLA